MYKQPRCIWIWGKDVVLYVGELCVSPPVISSLALYLTPIHTLRSSYKKWLVVSQMQRFSPTSFWPWWTCLWLSRLSFCITHWMEPKPFLSAAFVYTCQAPASLAAPYLCSHLTPHIHHHYTPQPCAPECWSSLPFLLTQGLCLNSVASVSEPRSLN